jgi:hypothetical protein
VTRRRVRRSCPAGRPGRLAERGVERRDEVKPNSARRLHPKGFPRPARPGRAAVDSRGPGAGSGESRPGAAAGSSGDSGQASSPHPDATPTRCLVGGCGAVASPGQLPDASPGRSGSPVPHRQQGGRVRSRRMRQLPARAAASTHRLAVESRTVRDLRPTGRPAAATPPRCQTIHRIALFHSARRTYAHTARQLPRLCPATVPLQPPPAGQGTPVEDNCSRCAGGEAAGDTPAAGSALSPRPPDLPVEDSIAQVWPAMKRTTRRRRRHEPPASRIAGQRAQIARPAPPRLPGDEEAHIRLPPVPGSPTRLAITEARQPSAAAGRTLSREGRREVEQPAAAPRRPAEAEGGPAPPTISPSQDERPFSIATTRGRGRAAAAHRPDQRPSLQQLHQPANESGENLPRHQRPPSLGGRRQVKRAGRRRCTRRAPLPAAPGGRRQTLHVSGAGADTEKAAR